MSKLIAEFPNRERVGKVQIFISLGGVELVCNTQLNLDPVEARTLATLLMHASNEAEMMKMRASMEEEHERAKEEVGKIASLVKPTP